MPSSFLLSAKMLFQVWILTNRSLTSVAVLSELRRKCRFVVCSSEVDKVITAKFFAHFSIEFVEKNVIVWFWTGVKG